MSEDIFDWEFYIYKYNDLQKANIDTKEKALEHWLQHGKKEERIITDIPIFFNWIKYIETNTDLQGHIETEEDAWRHYIYHGQYENRYIELKQRQIKIFYIKQK
jgi:hypothetical protein